MQVVLAHDLLGCCSQAVGQSCSHFKAQLGSKSLPPSAFHKTISQPPFLTTRITLVVRPSCSRLPGCPHGMAAGFHTVSEETESEREKEKEETKQMREHPRYRSHSHL